MAEEEIKEKSVEEVDKIIVKDKVEQRKSRKPREQKKDFKRENKDDFRFKRMRRKVCLLCKEKNYVLDYKDEETIRRFVNEKGKILPRRATGTCAKHQREIAKVIKRARHIAVLPYTTD